MHPICRDTRPRRRLPATLALLALGLAGSAACWMAAAAGTAGDGSGFAPDVPHRLALPAALAAPPCEDASRVCEDSLRSPAPGQAGPAPAASPSPAACSPRRGDTDAPHRPARSVPLKLGGADDEPAQAIRV